MPEWVERAKKRPWVAHLLRAVERFNTRLGSEFGAAITYFSVLALVPILMLAFSITGFVLTSVRPDLLDGVSRSQWPTPSAVRTRPPGRRSWRWSRTR